MNPLETTHALVRHENARLTTGDSLPVGQYAETDFHSLSLLNLIEIPFARKRTVLTCFVISLLLGWLSILLWPRTYESYAELLFMVGRENVSLDPTVTTGQTLLLQKSQEEDINSALKVLKSRRVLEMVIDRLGEQPILEGSLPESEGPSPADSSVATRIKEFASQMADYVLLNSGLRDAISDRELAVMKLNGSVGFDAPMKSTVITVQATSRTPQMAQAISQAVVDSFLELHVQTLQTKGSREFFVVQTQLANERLTEAQDTRRRFLEERKFMSIESKRDIFREQLSAIEMDLLSIQRDLEQALAKSTKLDTDSLGLEDTTLAGQQESSGSTWGVLRQRVYELELRELQESAKFSSEHPVLVATREELSGARKILADFQSQLSDKSTVPNPLKMRLQEELKLNDSQIEGLRSALTERINQRSEIETKIANLLEDESRLSMMDRDIEHYAASLRLMREKEEEARVIDELRLGGISAVSQFQPATFVERAVKPNKKLMMAAFVMLGIFGGLGLAYLREINSGAIRTASQVERNLDVPVIGQVGFRRGMRKVSALVDRPTASKDLLQVCRSALSEVLVRKGRNARPREGLTLGVIGIDRGSGASTTAMALALSSSEDFGMSTVLVDADRADRTISKLFGLNGAPGLSELAQGKATYEDCLQSAEKTAIRLVSNSSAYAVHQRNESSCEAVAEAIHQFQQSADFVIVDLPPASDLDKMIGLAQHMDHVIVVVESGRTELKSTARLLRTLRAANVNLVGVVLNKSKNFLPQSLTQILNANA